MILLVVLVPSSFLVSNIFVGIIWFLLPCYLIVINDITAYLAGGREDLGGGSMAHLLGEVLALGWGACWGDIAALSTCMRSYQVRLTHLGLSGRNNCPLPLRATPGFNPHNPNP